MQPSTASEPAKNPHSHTLRNALLAVGAAVAIVGAYGWFRPLELNDNIARARLWSQGMRSKYATLNGHRIHYYEGGSGSPVVLVHGLGSRALDWSNLIPYLLQGGHRVYAIDLLGYGQSDQPADASYSIAQEKGIVEAFLDDRGLKHFDLAGWSMGGWVAARVALDNPQRVGRLLLYDAAGLEFTPDFNLDVFTPTTPERWAALQKVLGPEPTRHLPAFVLRDVFRRQKKIGWVVERSVRAMMTGQDVLDGELATLKMPVLIVWGKQDDLIPLTVGEEFHARIPQSVLEIYDGCGHLAPARCADRIGPRTVRFLNAQPPMAAQSIEIPQATR